MCKTSKYRSRCAASLIRALPLTSSLAQIYRVTLPSFSTKLLRRLYYIQQRDYTTVHLRAKSYHIVERYARLTRDQINIKDVITQGKNSLAEELKILLATTQKE